MKDFIAALDLGGTNVRFGAVTRDGVVLKRRRAETPEGDGDLIVRFLIENLQGLIADLGDLTCSGIGVALPAIFAADAPGVPARLPNLPQLEGVRVDEIIESETRLPVTIENDATAATIGEHWLGASRGKNNVIGITLGTGVGGGLIFDGRPYRGANGSAGEIGHMRIVPDGRACGCGSRGCLEQYASGTAIVAEAVSANLRISTSEDVDALAREGDAEALEILASAGRHLGFALGNLVIVLAPDIIVIGGGVAGAWDHFIGPLKSEISSNTFNGMAESVEVVRATLGDDSGILGAARSAWHHA